MVQNQWPEVGRIAWLGGGLVAHSAPQDDTVIVNIGGNGRPFCTFRIPVFGALCPILVEKGFKIIGVTFLTHPDQFTSVLPPEFRAFHPSRGWPTWETKQKWREVAFHSSKRGEMHLLDLASRIGYGLEYCQLRLQDLVEAYSQQLFAHLHPNKLPAFRQRFSDGHDRYVYKAIHALFWELGVLRDAIAEFVAKILLSRDEITSIGGLLKSSRKAPFTDPFALMLTESAKDEKTGIGEFSLYRNFFTHIAPLQWANGFAMAVQDLLVLRDGVGAPQIYYPLPPNIKELTARRIKGQFFSSMAEMMDTTNEWAHRETHLDALEYLHKFLGYFAELARQLLARSPIPPQPIVFTKDDVIDFTFQEGDVTWKFK